LEELDYIVPIVPSMLADRGMEDCGAIVAGFCGVGWILVVEGRMWDVVLCCGLLTVHTMEIGQGQCAGGVEPPCTVL